MVIGNIVSRSKINVGSEFNVVESINDIILTDLPTLIVGYDVVLNLYQDEDINLLNRKINGNIYWTFKKNVKRNLYQLDLENFIILSYKKYVDKIISVSPDIIQDSPKKLRNIIRKILSLDNIISYESELGVIYLYSTNIICCVDLNLLEFGGYDINKIKNKIKDKSLKYLIGNEVVLEYQNHLDRLNNEIKLIPLLYSINSHA